MKVPKPELTERRQQVRVADGVLIFCVGFLISLRCQHLQKLSHTHLHERRDILSAADIARQIFLDEFRDRGCARAR